MKTDGKQCKRPYELGKRQEASERTREAVLAAAREQLGTAGMRELTMESLARVSGVTRQTIHNLFGSKRAILEMLFDRLAMDAGMMRMREVMMARDGESMLAAMVDVFTGFWSQERLVLRRIRGLAASDPEFGQAVEERNRRRHGIAGRIIERLYAGTELGEQERTERIAWLVALTSFEFFDQAAEACGNAEKARESISRLVRMIFNRGSQNGDRGQPA